MSDELNGNGLVTSARHRGGDHSVHQPAVEHPGGDPLGPRVVCFYRGVKQPLDALRLSGRAGDDRHVAKLLKE